MSAGAPARPPAAWSGRVAGIAALGIVLGLGLCLRLVDLGRPFYGYHMWNEAYYVTIARNFDHFGFLNSYNYDWRGGAELSQRHGPSPLVPWLVYLSSRLFGPSEVAARLPMLLLGMLSLLALHGIARALYDDRLALLATFFAAIMPGVVFLSRQVALDSPMVAFGLISVWTLLAARREGRWRWALAFTSAVSLGVAVLVKYTGVLFVPLLGWIWLGLIGRAPGRSRLRWLLPGAYFVVAALPALAWMARGLLAPGGGRGHVAEYLDRSGEWELRYWLRAANTTWVRTGQQVGQHLWYPLVLLALVAATPRRAAAFVRQHAEVLLLVVPWLALLVYPISWYQNDAYTYPALYGIAILLALAVRWAARLAQELLRPSRERALACAGLLIALAVLGCLSDYRQYFGAWYKDRDYGSNLALQLPSNLISQLDPYAPARWVRARNTSRLPILADTPATLYYAQDVYWEGKATWYWWMLPGELDLLLRAIGSGKYGYVVFTYQPPAMVVTALGDARYASVGPGVWWKAPGP